MDSAVSMPQTCAWWFRHNLSRLYFQRDRLHDKIYHYLNPEKASQPETETSNRWFYRPIFSKQVSPFSQSLHLLAKYFERFEILKQRFGLNSFECDVLMLALLPHIDSRYLGWFSDAQKNPALQYPTADFALELFSGNAFEKVEKTRYLLPGGRLLNFGLLEMGARFGEDVRCLGTAELKLDQALVHFLLGHDIFPSKLRPSCEWVQPVPRVSGDLINFCQGLQRILFTKYMPVRLLLQGADQYASVEVVAFAANQHDMASLLLNVELLPEQDDAAYGILLSALREAQLRSACLVIAALDQLSSKRKILFSLFTRLLETYCQPVVVLHEKGKGYISLGKLAQITVQMPATHISQMALLARELQDMAQAEGVDPLHLVRGFSIHASSVPTVLLEAEWYRQFRDDRAVLASADLQAALKARAQQSLENLAQRISPSRNLDDLVIDRELYDHLQEFLVAVHQRQQVLADGFAQKMQYGLGISALFYGASGTGKTMAVEVIANSLHVDVIKIDLSTIINKYIGETEKNIARIFAIAERENSVLFFDEADALFGKRSEVQDAHDRHANIEVSYLLQCMEAHPGVVILATNHRDHLDPAFTRRFTFMMKFSQPDRNTRAQLWQRVWPKDISVAAEVDFEKIAEMAAISGANIRNIAFLATLLARGEGRQEVQLCHIENALQRELEKIGKIIFV